MENVIIEFLNSVLIIESSVILELENIKSDEEDGGVLFGSKLLEKEEYIISGKTSKQIDDSYSRTSFFRRSCKHLDIINEIWKKDNCTMYYGDWHYHPVSIVEPSSTDLDSFKKTCKFCKSSSKYLFFIITAKDEFILYIYNKKKKKKIFEKKIVFKGLKKN